MPRIPAVVINGPLRARELFVELRDGRPPQSVDWLVHGRNYRYLFAGWSEPRMGVTEPLYTYAHAA